MLAGDIRQRFLDFFNAKEHKIVPSAPIVVKDDPTLMFTNAGMNQFKDYFLGNATPESPRAADTQKCLRVSGKHNDLEEVGHDTYHHTMFEMLGNWSFGDYFKAEAIEWAWELLTDVYKIDQDRLYITVFGGEDGVEKDTEAAEHWQAHIPADRILFFGKKDNFWEMGDTGPCGPCSEIHVDIRSDEERQKKDGAELVNADHPQVVELWNLVFIEFNKKQDGTLENLPARHVDTGMGFERLCMVLQAKQSNYDTDVFSPLLDQIARSAGTEYGKDESNDIAMRVMADHIRAVAFCIADGQLPSNEGAGYVVRRILRRAVRYGFNSFNIKEPFLESLVPVLADQMKDVFPELHAQVDTVRQIIAEEENSFLRTLGNGTKRLQEIIENNKGEQLDGKTVFELYDTFGFPADLTALIAREHDLGIDEAGFEEEMGKQKSRSRADAEVEAADWVDLSSGDGSMFTGYSSLEETTKVIKYRTQKSKKGDVHSIVLHTTPFYAESGGQVGDTGTLDFDGETVEVIDTQKENDLIIHITDKIPAKVDSEVKATVNSNRRQSTIYNHSATHLLHAALRNVLGDHVQQKGSLVHPDYLRFDFSHFQKMSEEEVSAVEAMVNERIRANNPVNIESDVPIDQAKEMGAMALFGEKYGDHVRVVKMDPAYSIELCGGTHVNATGDIGLFKIIQETSVAAGIRRIEAITAKTAETYVNDKLEQLKEISELVKNKQDLTGGIRQLIEENNELRKATAQQGASKSKELTKSLADSVEQINDINFIGQVVELDGDGLKQVAFELKKAIDPLFLILGAKGNGKPLLTIMVSEGLIQDKQLHAGNMIRELSAEIGGGGGGKDFYATAGGKDPAGLQRAIDKAKEHIANL
jgi:alanyl-tRNA synthetase